MWPKKAPFSGKITPTIYVTLMAIYMSLIKPVKYLYNRVFDLITWYEVNNDNMEECG